jgi:hypothetical protein
MPNEILYNILLGRHWIHEMHVISSNLHSKMNYAYNNKVYTIDANLEPEICLNIEKGKENFLKILTPPIEIDPMQ